MAGMIGDTVDEARHLLQQIVRELANQSSSLHDIANKPPESVKLTNLNVLSEAQLRTVPFEKEVNTVLFGPQAGVYTKVNHWSAAFGAAGKAALFYGQQGQPLAIVDCALNSLEWITSNPNELVIPPNFGLFVFGTQPGSITVSLTTYGLTI